MQFEKSSGEFDLINISNNNERLEYAVKFFQSDLSLATIEELIYQRDCIKSLSEKTFESLQLMTEKIVNLEKESRTYSNIK
jgi:hypothetical protein